jgi:ATP-dependent DNA helicase RecG
LGALRIDGDVAKRDKLLRNLRASDRVKPSVKEKTDIELLDHYQLARGETFTNLGILCLGTQFQRSQLTTAPVIQFIKFDEYGQKVNKLAWDDYTRLGFAGTA